MPVPSVPPSTPPQPLGKAHGRAWPVGQIREAGEGGDSQKCPAPFAPAPGKLGPPAAGLPGPPQSCLQSQGEAVWRKCCLRSAGSGQEVGTSSSAATQASRPPRSPFCTSTLGLARCGSEAASGPLARTAPFESPEPAFAFSPFKDICSSNCKCIRPHDPGTPHRRR